MIRPEELVLLPDDKPIDEAIGKILTADSLKIIDTTLVKYFDTKVIESFGLLEKINLYLSLASKDAIFIPPQLRKIVRDVNQILPGEKINTDYITKLDRKKRNKIIYIITTAAVLVTLCFTAVKGIDAAQFARNLNRIEESTDPPEVPSEQNSESEQEPNPESELLLKEQQARAEFERRYSQDLETAVAELGWESFIEEYHTQEYQKLWAPDKVLNLLITQEPRYWCRYMIKYPDSFTESIQKKGITLSEFISSCGPKNFLNRLESEREEGTKGKQDAFTLWTTEEILTTLKTLDPDWINLIKEYPEVFAGHLEKNDLKQIISYGLSHDKSDAMDFFFNDYNSNWDRSWSRRDVIEEVKTQSPLGWKDWVIAYPNGFADSLTAAELAAVIENVSLHSANGTSSAFSEPQSYLFDNYYALKLYHVMSPTEFRTLLEKNFSEPVMEVIIFNNPELDNLKNLSIQKLFETEAISYILENYDSWKIHCPMNEILKFLRSENNDEYYNLIVPYPKAFQGVTLTESEILQIAYPTAADLVKKIFPTDFYENYSSEFGWKNIISATQLITIGKTNNITTINDAVLQYPEIFLPHLTDSELLSFILTNADELETLDVLKTTDKKWLQVSSIENRRRLFENSKFAKNTSFTWEWLGTNHPYFFGEFMSFANAQDAMRTNYTSDFREYSLWTSNTTLEWEYHFLQTLPENIFAKAVIENSSDFGPLLTNAEWKTVLKHESTTIVQKYRHFRRWLPPEFIADYWLSGESELPIPNKMIIDNGKIFSHLFYTRTDLPIIIQQGGHEGLFDDLNAADQSYLDWAELVNLGELYNILIASNESRITILKNPSLFLDFVQPSDIDTFIEPGRNSLGMILENSEWQEIWSIETIYQSAKKQHIEGLAPFILDDEYRDMFAKFIKNEDLDPLIESYVINELNNDTDEFSDQLPYLLKHWSKQRVLAALKTHHPNSWGSFVSVTETQFANLLSKEDLNELIRTGGNPHDLMSVGLWTSKELLTGYQLTMPELWGGYVVQYPDVFREEVAKQEIPFMRVMDAGGDMWISEFIGAWVDLVWSEAEIYGFIENQSSE